MERKVSMIGRPRAMIGIRIAKAVDPFRLLKRERTERMKPRK